MGFHNIIAEKFVELLLTELLRHRRDAEQLLFIGVVARSRNNGCHLRFVPEFPDASPFDQLEVRILFTLHRLIQCIGSDVLGPVDQIIDSRKNLCDLGRGQFRRRSEFIFGQFRVVFRSLPAGGLDHVGEPYIDAAKRELREETGYSCDDLEPLITVNTTVAFCNEIIPIYVAFIKGERKEQELDDDEFVNVEYFTIDELMDKIYKMEITDSKTIASLMAYKNKYVK